jgi:uncharacterized protein
MKTPIAQDLRNRGWLLAAYAAVGVAVVSLDLWTIWQEDAIGWFDWGGPLATLALLAFVLPGTVSRESLGLRPTPIQPVRYWLWVAVIIAAAILILAVGCTAVAKTLGFDAPLEKIPPGQVPMRFVQACLMAPLVEEVIYRFAICVPATAILGPTGAILLSGAVFAGLHFVYGNPGPDNFVAGYILAWAYLKSGSIVVPIALHALGNSFTVALHAANWFIA